MKTTRIMAVAVLIVGSGLALHVAQAQQPGIKRTDLMRHDLSVPGREVIQVRVDFAPGVAPRRAQPSGRRDRLRHRRLARVSARGPAAGDAQGRRRLVHPGRKDPLGEERRQRQRGGARHVYRRKREAARRAGSGDRPGEVTGGDGISDQEDTKGDCHEPTQRCDRTRCRTLHRNGRHEARGRRHPCFGCRPRQALLRRLGLAARRRLRRR